MKSEMKYEKPKLVEISKLETAAGVCDLGSSNIEICQPGDAVIPGCVGGGRPTIDCAVGTQN